MLLSNPKPFIGISKRGLKKLENYIHMDDNYQQGIPDKKHPIYKLMDSDINEIGGFSKLLVEIPYTKDQSEEFYNMAVIYKKAARKSAEFLVEGGSNSRLDSVFFFSIVYV